ncbi:flagellar hook-associated protein FlgL, partial [Aquifex sp.]
MRVPELSLFRFFEIENAKTRERLGKQFERLASGKRFLNPSEDPYSAYRIFQLRTDIAKISQFSRNRLFSDNALSHADTILSGMEDKLRQLYSRTIRGANQLLKPEELKALSEEFTQALKILVSQANEKFGNNYLFSGDALTTKPFDETTYDYNGSLNPYEVVLENSLRTTTFLSGSEVFGINVSLSVYDVEILGFDDDPNNDDVSFSIDSTTIAGDSLDEILSKIRDTFGEDIRFYTYTNDAGRTVIRLVLENPLKVSAGDKTKVTRKDLTNIFKAVNYVKEKLSRGLPLGYEDIYLMEKSLK